MWEEREDDEHELLEPKPAFALRLSHINSPSRVIPSQRVQIAAGGSPNKSTSVLNYPHAASDLAKFSRRSDPHSFHNSQ